MREIRIEHITRLVVDPRSGATISREHRLKCGLVRRANHEPAPVEGYVCQLQGGINGARRLPVHRHWRMPVGPAHVPLVEVAVADDLGLEQIADSSAVACVPDY